MSTVRIETRPSDDPALAVLLLAAVAELRRRYPDYTGPLPIDPRTEFLIALVDDQPAGCVGMFPVDEHVVEMKRMYVDPAYRGRGVARSLIARLERQALACGFTRMRLETGENQPEAIKLYEKTGFERVPPFYDAFPGSRFFAKRLPAGDRAGQQVESG